MCESDQTVVIIFNRPARVVSSRHNNLTSTAILTLPGASMNQYS